MKRFLRYASIVICVAAMVSCGVTRNLADDEYILSRNKINTDPEVDKEEMITARELNRYVRQSPAPKFLGTDLPIWLYHQAKPAKDNGWNNFLRSLGSPPTILDTTLTVLSTNNLKLYMDSRGFRESVSDFQIRYRPRRQRANVTYTVWQGTPSRIGNITYDFQDKFLEQVIRADSAATLLHTGDLFDTNVMNDERNRIAGYLRDRGYYNFSVDNIVYTAYMDEGDHEVDIKMTVRQNVTDFDENNNPVRENNAVYRINEIYVFADYDLAAATQDSTYFEKLDTVWYQGIGVISHGRSVVRPATLRRAVNIYSGNIYSQTDTRRAAENLMRLGYYKGANVIFEEVPPGPDDEMVTYVGGDQEDIDRAQHTVQRQLTCNIFCTPALKQNYSIDFEATMTELFYGLKANASYQNRNFLRGSELFDMSLTAGYEFYRADGAANSFEFGGSVGISFPRFITPFKVDRAGRSIRPSTRIDFSINTQNRPQYYNRTITGANLSYSWSNEKKSSFTFKPLTFNLVKSSLDPDFQTELEEIGNAYLLYSYQSQFIPAISGTYVYNNPTLNLRGNSMALRFNIEAAGNLSTFLSKEVVGKKGTATLFSVPIAQYVRGDVNLSYNIPLGERTSLAWRVFGGIGIPYGNSLSLPFDRMYYVGGANSMRGWQVRTLGPGNYMPELDENGKPKKTRYPIQTGDIRLEANLELRFPIAGVLRGALFLDAGNIWMLPKTTEKPEEEFRFGSFYKQLGFNTGLGLRVDVQFVVFRLDWGVQLHNPNRLPRNRWIRKFDWGDTALSFGVGFPF